MVSYDELLQVCASFTGDNYYVGREIPQKKLANARKHYEIPPQELIVALIDTTAFGSAKNGLAICETGIYCRDFSEQPQYSPWPEFSTLDIVAKGGFNRRVEVGGTKILTLGGINFSNDAINALFADIRYLIIAASSMNLPERWMLAVNGSQYGPYDLQTIRVMVVERQIDPATCLAWREGMSNWTPLERDPDLAALLPGAAPQTTIAPPPLPPPPLPSSASTDPRVGKNTEKLPYRYADLNRAPLDDLLALPGMTMLNGPKLVRERSRRGGFGTVEEVGRFLELPPHQVERLKEQSFVSAIEGTRPRDRRVVDF